MSVNDKAVFKLTTNIGEYENLINQNPAQLVLIKLRIRNRDIIANV